MGSDAEEALQQNITSLMNFSERIGLKRFLKINQLWQQVKSSKFHHFCLRVSTAWKVSKYEVFSGPYFSAFGLNSEREKCPNTEFFLVRIFRMEFGHFSRSDQVDYMIKIFEK